MNIPITGKCLCNLGKNKFICNKYYVTNIWFYYKMNDNERIGDDAQSYSNFNDNVVVHLDLNLKIDFTKKIFSGFVDITTKILQSNIANLYLDAKFLEIKR